MKRFHVANFEYNGFMGRRKTGFTHYTATFKEWAPDPGVGRFNCSDGKVRLIPTFALVGRVEGDLPEQPKTGVLFGEACES